jgi:hypothetical protein
MAVLAVAVAGGYHRLESSFGIIQQADHTRAVSTAYLRGTLHSLSCHYSNGLPDRPRLDR